MTVSGNASVIGVLVLIGFIVRLVEGTLDCELGAADKVLVLSREGGAALNRCHT